MHGRLKAADLWERYRLSVPVDLRQLVAALDLDVVTFLFEDG